ncbi:MAG: hypothetical protein AB1715_08715, partial [Acidobacteriota bacterium]
GDELVLRKFDKDASSLCVLDGNLIERKAFRLPFLSYYPTQLWGADHYVFVIDSEKHQLWGVDLKTEEWTRIY